MRLSPAKLRGNFLILSWALYDLANQFFALNVVSLYFPRWLTTEKQSPEVFYSIFFGISMFFVAVSAPVLGTISDIKGRRKTFLVYFTLISVVFTMALGFSSNVFLALILFAIANFGCQGAVVFYNALIVKVAPKDKLGFVSGIGRMFGYIGAIAALYFTKPVILKMGYQATFRITALFFLVFSLPCMIFMKDESKEKLNLSYFFDRKVYVQVFQRLKKTLFDNYRLKDFRNFLKAAFFGLCVVNATILFMSVYVGKVFGLTEAGIIDLVAFSTLFAILASFLSGIISDRLGYKKSLIGVFMLWITCLLLGAILKAPFHWLIGALAGASLGSTWVISRALVIKIVPKEEIGEIFGLFNLVGYFSAIAGPLLWGIIIWFSSSLEGFGYRLACLSSIVFMVIGIIFLLRIDKGNAT
ncbi:MAG: MFS transporter [Candidatus Omnitrophica bacterium]|nr:MFS transporter [Candidatus Omnitrophota bacterium]